MFLATIGIVATPGGPPPAGTLLSSFCENTSGYDDNGNLWNGAWTAIGVYANGTGGSYQNPIGDNTNGCYHPYGWVYTYETYPSTLSWTHGDYNGDYSYGYTYSATIANGSGGTTDGSGSQITSSDGDLINSYTAYDEGAGYEIQYRLLFELVSGYPPTTREVNWPVAGAVLGSSCVGVDIQDAAGGNWYVNAVRSTIADGIGGSFTSDETNNPDCGYLPSGYVSSRSIYDLYLYYSSAEVGDATWQYGQQFTDSVQDGSGQYTTLEPTNNIWYAAGYIFYQYYDGAGNQTIYYHFDGVNSYYTTTST